MICSYHIVGVGEQSAVAYAVADVLSQITVNSSVISSGRNSTLLNITSAVTHGHESNTTAAKPHSVIRHQQLNRFMSKNKHLYNKLTGIYNSIKLTCITV